MKKKDKKNSIAYWNRHASDWEKMAYNKEKKYLRFPSSAQRENITVNEIKKIASSKNISIIDLGCANGELVRHLLRDGFKNVHGVDNSAKMIALAKQFLKKEIPAVDANAVFSVCDVDDLKENRPFDVITGMGIIEYLLDLNSFFSKVAKGLKKGGYAFIESRNKLFNLSSANRYTEESDIGTLVKSVGDSARFSPIQDKKSIEKIVLRTFVAIGNNLKTVTPQKSKEGKKFESYPFSLPQYTPQEIAALCQKHSLKVKYVIYYHPHPFPPKFSHEFPRTFNRIALGMEPLGYTPIGATMCSSFIAVMQKSR